MVIEIMYYYYLCMKRLQEYKKYVILKKNSIQFKETYTYVTITGKGNKTRTVPINSNLSLILKDYFDTFKISDDDYLFKNKNNNKLTTKGISYIFLNMYINRKIVIPKNLKNIIVLIVCVILKQCIY